MSAISVGYDERLWREWTQAPWHAWMRHYPELTSVLLDAVLKIPRTVTLKLLQPVCPLIVLPPVAYGRVLRVNAKLLAGAHIMQLDESLTKRPAPEAAAIIAHEIAHLTFAPSGDPEKDDLMADQIAIQWGFGAGILAALERDLGPSHARTKTARSATAVALTQS